MPWCLVYIDQQNLVDMHQEKDKDTQDNQAMKAGSFN